MLKWQTSNQNVITKNQTPSPFLQIFDNDSSIDSWFIYTCITFSLHLEYAIICLSNVTNRASSRACNEIEINIGWPATNGRFHGGHHATELSVFVFNYRSESDNVGNHPPNYTYVRVSYKFYNYYIEHVVIHMGQLKVVLVDFGFGCWAETI